MSNPEYPDADERAEIELRRRLTREAKERAHVASKGRSRCPHCGGNVGLNHACHRRKNPAKDRP